MTDDDKLIEAMHEALMDSMGARMLARDKRGIEGRGMSTAKRLTPNKIANLVMADEAWHDSEYVAASDYDALSVELAALRADAERMKWLADYMVEIEYEPTPEETVCIWLLMNKELRRECYETSDLRAAIDAAMRVEG